MKISIGINGFKLEQDLLPREKFCLDSLRICKQKYPEINLFLIKNTRDNITYKDFNTIEIEHNTKYPLVNKLLDCLSETSCDLFVFLNNDIILNTSFFKLLDEQYETYIASRAHLYELNSLNEDLKIESYSVHGFDLFAFKKHWWLENKQLFPDMFLGRSYWDTLYFTKCAKYSKYLAINKQPPVIFHIEHQSTAAHSTDIYTKHNEDIAKNCVDMSKWWYYVYNVLLKRPTVNGIKWWNPLDNELELEKAIFKQ
jgi:hypothetical protein